MLNRVFPAAALLCGLLISPWAIAAHVHQRPESFTDIRDAGIEYGFQGEYVGRVTGGYRPVQIGIQIIARPNQQLSAVEYQGGLPGSGWDGSAKKYLDGTFNKSVAILNGSQRKLVIVNNELWVMTPGDVMRGIIKKVHRQSPTMGLLPPPGADVLFDGQSTIRLQGGRMTNSGLLMEGAETLDVYDDFRMHLEFRTPFMPTAEGQARGNSGIYIQRRYELQILDSFGLEREYNFCGSLYKTRPPDVNMCLPPLVWQTYDVWFRAARYDADRNKTEDARITVLLNGVLIHDDVPIPNKTGAGQPEGPEPKTILFQDHHDPVRFRNIWLVNQSYPDHFDWVSPYRSYDCNDCVDVETKPKPSSLFPPARTDVARNPLPPLGFDRR